MATLLSRREALVLAAVPCLAASRPKGVIIDTHIHLFASDPRQFPYHPSATYKPPAAPLEAYNRFALEAKLDHTIIVHPEPYQDDHRYLEFCFAHEPVPGYFKGTCLFDPIDPRTPERMRELTQRNPKRIVALRIHINRAPDAPPTTSGAIRDRDLRHPQMKKTWEAAHSMGLGVQMHFIPHWAGQIGELVAAFPDTPVILDHLARSRQGTSAEYDNVLKLAKTGRVYMKFSGLSYSSKQGYPFKDAEPLVRRTYDAFGPDRMVWGGVGANMEQFGKAVEVFERMFAFVSEADRAKIRGLTAATLFRF